MRGPTRAIRLMLDEHAEWVGPYHGGLAISFTLNATYHGVAFWLLVGGPPLVWRRTTGVARTILVSLARVSTRCPQCGYELRNRISAGCPECGWNRTDFPSTSIEENEDDLPRSGRVE